jgi:hypothetical protein
MKAKENGVWKRATAGTCDKRVGGPMYKGKIGPYSQIRWRSEPFMNRSRYTINKNSFLTDEAEKEDQRHFDDFKR